VVLEPFKNKAYTMLKNSISTARTLQDVRIYGLKREGGELFKRGF